MTTDNNNYLLRMLESPNLKVRKLINFKYQENNKNAMLIDYDGKLGKIISLSYLQNLSFCDTFKISFTTM